MKEYEIIRTKWLEIATMKLERESSKHDGFQCDGPSKGHKIPNGGNQIRSSR